MKKKFLSVLLSLAMIFSLLPMAAFAAEGDTGKAASTFPDAASHWGKASIQRWAGYGVLNGDDKGNFNPDNPMTRAEFSTMLVNLMGYTGKAQNTFADVDTSMWYADAVLKLAAAGIMKGDGTNASPNAYISRQEAAVLLCRVFGITPNGSSVSFADKGSIASWAMDSVIALSERNMIAGMGNNSFAPLDNINRASVAKMIDNMITTYVASGTVTVDKSTDGIVLVAGGSVTVKADATVARLVVAPKASGSTVTVEKKATVTSMEIAGSNASVKGEGTIKALTVTGSGVTVDKDVTVSKLVNSGSSAVTYGDKTVKAGDTYTGSSSEPPSTPSGSGGGGGHGGGNKDTSSSKDDITTAEDFITQAQVAKDNVTAEVKTGATISGNLSITNDSATTLTLDLKASQVGNVEINAAKATTITLKGTDGDVAATIASLTVNAPNATVNNDVAVTGTVTIKAVSPNSYHANAATGAISVEGKGKVVVNSDVATAPAITVNTEAVVTLTGKVGDVTINKAKNLTLTGLSGTAPVVTSQDTDAVIKVESPVTLKGAVSQVTTSATVTLSGAVVSEIATSGSNAVEIKAEGTSNNVGTVQAATPVSLGTSVDKVVVGTGAGEITLTDKAVTVSAIDTDKDVTLTGVGSVGAINVTDTSKKIIITSQEDAATGNKVGVTSVSVIGENADTTKVELSGAAVENLVVEKKAEVPTGIHFEQPTGTTGENAKGTITGLKAGLEVSKDGEAYADVTSDATSMKVDAGHTYSIRVKETADTLASDAVKGTITVAVGVKSAAITGSPIVNQTLTANANGDATGTLSYQWTVEGSAASIGKNQTLPVTDQYFGKKITVTISNYGEPGKTATIGAVVLDTATYDLAVTAAGNAQVGVMIGAAADQVAAGARFVTEAESKALADALTAAEKAVTEAIKQSEVNAAVKTLNAAVETYTKAAAKTGTMTDETKLKAALSALVTEAKALYGNNAVVTSVDGLDKVPDTKWVTTAEMKALTEAIDTADKATADLEKAITTLNAAMAAFQGAVKTTGAVDTAALLTAIADAQKNAASVATSENGTDVLPSLQWVTTGQLNEYKGKITEATNTANLTTQTTQNTIKEAITTLATATATFNGQKAAGTKDIVPPAITIVSVNRTSTAATIVFTSNEDGKYSYSYLAKDAAADSNPTASENVTEIKAGVPAAITLTGLDATKTYTLSITVGDGTTENTVTGNITISKVNVPEFQAGDVIAATLHDTRAGEKTEADGTFVPDKKLVEENSYTVSQKAGTDGVINVTINARHLMQHQAGNSALGYWVGIGIPAKTGDQFVQGYGSSDGLNLANLYYKMTSDGTMTDGANSYNTFYFDKQKPEKVEGQATNADGKNGYVAVRHAGENASYTLYKVNFSAVQCAPAVENMEVWIVRDEESYNRIPAAYRTEDGGYPWNDEYLSADSAAKLPWLAVKYTSNTTSDFTMSVKNASKEVTLSEGSTGGKNSINAERYQLWHLTTTEGKDYLTQTDPTGSYVVTIAKDGATFSNETPAVYDLSSVNTAVELTAALKAVTAEQKIVTLGNDISIDATSLSNAWREKTVVLDLQKHTLTITKPNGSSADATVFVGPAITGDGETTVTAEPGQEGNCARTDITIQNGNVKADNVSGDTKANFAVETGHKLTFAGTGVDLSASGSAIIVRGKNAALNVQNSTITAAGVYAVSTNAKAPANHGVVITIKDSDLKTNQPNGDDCPVLINVPSTVTISGGSITGQRMGMLVRAGKVTVDGTKISATIGKYYDQGILGYYTGNWGSGNEAPWGAVVVGKGTATYAGNIDMTLTSCTLSCALLDKPNQSVTEKYCSALFASKLKNDAGADSSKVTMNDCRVTTGNVVDFGDSNMVSSFDSEISALPTTNVPKT